MSNDCAEPNVGSKICIKCQTKQQSNTDWKCYHIEMSNSEQLKHYEDALNDLQELWTADLDEGEIEVKWGIIQEYYILRTCRCQ